MKELYPWNSVNTVQKVQLCHFADPWKDDSKLFAGTVPGLPALAEQVKGLLLVSTS